MNSLALLALLALSSQPQPAPARQAPSSRQQAAKAAADMENISALLNASLQYCDGADLEADKQRQCLRDTWHDADADEMDCLPFLAVDQAKAALAALLEAKKLLAQASISKNDKAALVKLTDKIASSAAGLELRSQQLSEAVERDRDYTSSYEAGTEAAETANSIQLIAGELRQTLSGSAGQ